jgi:hypothetical protein
MVPIASKESLRKFFKSFGVPLVRWLHWGEVGVPIGPSGVNAKKEDQSFEADARAAVAFPGRWGRSRKGMELTCWCVLSAPFFLGQ